MAEWSFLTNHARVLMSYRPRPRVGTRDIATTLDITERSAYSIVTDLTASRCVVKAKNGRRNRYQIRHHLPLRDAITQQRTIGEVLDVLVESDIRTRGRTLGDLMVAALPRPDSGTPSSFRTTRPNARRRWRRQCGRWRATRRKAGDRRPVNVPRVPCQSAFDLATRPLKSDAERMIGRAGTYRAGASFSAGSTRPQTAYLSLRAPISAPVDQFGVPVQTSTPRSPRRPGCRPAPFGLQHRGLDRLANHSSKMNARPIVTPPTWCPASM
jgi:hypothetical protein